MDIKEFKKNIKKGCHFMKSPAERKDCMDTMMCNWNHCQKEAIESANAVLTNAERESCKNKDYSKQFVCEQKITEKKGLLDKMAAYAHCQANKCPQIRQLIRRTTNKFLKHKLSKTIKIL